MNFAPVIEHWPLFLQGVINTIIVCVVTFFAGFALAIPLALARLSKIPVLSQIAWLWIYVFRSSPLLILTYLLYFGLPQFSFIRNGIFWPVLREAWWCVMIALTINGAAYMAEIIRVAISIVPKGELESAISVGMTRWHRFRRITLPRAFGLALPMIANEAVFKIHSSAFISTVTIMDVLGAGQYVNTRYYLPYEGYLASAAIYFALISLTTWIMSRIERRALRYLHVRAE